MSLCKLRRHTAIFKGYTLSIPLLVNVKCITQEVEKRGKIMSSKALQEVVNSKVLFIIDEINNSDVNYSRAYPLRSCSAEVYKGSRFIVLKSYSTIIAAIDTDTDTLYDFLRYVYGYTATSAQHIAKFSHDYGKGYWGCCSRLTYRPI